jgi:DNA-binding CsgD family transcriptional regulator
MNNRKMNIGLFLSSPLLAEGLTALIRRCDRPVSFITLEKFSDLEAGVMHEAPDVVIADPLCIVNRLKEFSSVKKSHPGVSWVGMVYCYTDPQVLSRFDHLLQVTDSAETVIALINRLGKPAEQTEPESGQLSDRETEVLRLLVNGLSHKEIADRLNISIHTVISHRKNISVKTGIRTQSGLTIYALTNRIISLGDFPG